MKCTGYDGNEFAVIEQCCDTAKAEFNLSFGYDTLANRFVIYQLCSKFQPGGLGVHGEVPIQNCPWCPAKAEGYVAPPEKPQRRVKQSSHL